MTHQAMSLMAQSGMTSVWVGEAAVRYYAHGAPLTRSSRLVEAQAHLVSRPKDRLRVAREMYLRRFPGEAVGGLSMEQLRGREGARVRAAYKSESERTGVPWRRRQYNPEDFATGDAVNQALSAANHCLYGIVHTVIVSLACSPALGFVHNGTERAFVFDIADLYKTEMTVPVAFEVAAMANEDTELDIPAATRRLFRDRQHSGGLLGRCTRDVKELLLGPDEAASEPMGDVVMLWDERGASVAGGVNYDEVYEVPW